MDVLPLRLTILTTPTVGVPLVILCALFQLTHKPAANIMLFMAWAQSIGVLHTAFDRPFDKTSDGREIPTHITRVSRSGNVTYAESLC
jgi:hypothetical protein